MVDRDIGTQSGCCGIHDVVVLVLGQVIETEDIFVDRCLETQGQLILRGVFNLQNKFPTIKIFSYQLYNLRHNGF